MSHTGQFVFRLSFGSTTMDAEAEGGADEETDMLSVEFERTDAAREKGEACSGCKPPTEPDRGLACEPPPTPGAALTERTGAEMLGAGPRLIDAVSPADLPPRCGGG